MNQGERIPEEEEEESNKDFRKHWNTETGSLKELQSIGKYINYGRKGVKKLEITDKMHSRSHMTKRRDGTKM